MDGEYIYSIEVERARPALFSRYGFVASIVDLRCHHPDGTVERYASPLGEYHGQDADEAEKRARASVERWLAMRQPD